VSDQFGCWQDENPVQTSPEAVVDLIGSARDSILIPGWLVLGDVGLFFLLLSLGAGALVLLSAPGTPSTFHYLVIFGMFAIVGFGVVAALNLVLFLVCWELAALFAWGIARIGADGGAERVSTVPYHASGLIGTVLMVVAILGIWGRTDTLVVARDLMPASSTIGWLVLGAVLFKVLGLMAEISHPAADGTFSISPALIASSTVPIIAFYPLLRFGIDLPTMMVAWRESAMLVALGIALIAALAALGSSDAMRMLGHGILSQFGLITAGLLIGGPGAKSGAMLMIVAFTLSFSGLLLVLGQAQAIAGQLRVDHLNGLLRHLPLAAILYLICAASIVGLPIALGLGIGTVGIGAVSTAVTQGSATGAAMWIAVHVLTLCYLLRIFGALFLGEPRLARPSHRYAMGYLGMFVVSAMLIFGGVRVDGVLQWTDAIVRSLV
jgi:multicomponent Na+:H+ antiporter subunit D